MIRAGIIGATGYVGIEICRILSQHPDVKITQTITHSYYGIDIARIYPHLVNHVFNKGNELDLNLLIEECDVVFVSLPHGEAIKIVPSLIAAGKKVIDVGPDFRLKNPADYKKWYKLESAPIDLINQAVYGLPEVTNKESIKNANLIANPGCNTTAMILATYPALIQNIINTDDCIYDVKLSISGGGRKPTVGNLFCEISDNIYPFDLAGEHRHTPEAEQELSLIAQKPIVIQFSPHLLPITRGILVTAYFKLNESMAAHEVHSLYKRVYEHEPFIRIRTLGKMAKIKNVRGTNYCDISIHVDMRTKRLVVLSVIDNLVKGAAGQAIQNMNLMYNLPQTTGLDHFVTIYP